MQTRSLEVIKLEYSQKFMYTSVMGWEAMLDSWGMNINSTLASLLALRAIVIYIETWNQGQAAIKKVLETQLPLLCHRRVLRFSSIRWAHRHVKLGWMADSEAL